MKHVTLSLLLVSALVRTATGAEPVTRALDAAGHRVGAVTESVLEHQGSQIEKRRLDDIRKSL